MKFYGRGIVWDAKNGRRLVKFENGVYETDKPYIIAELTRLGYKHDEAKEPYAGKKVSELREAGKELGLTFPVGTTKADMIAAIEEGTNNG